MASLSVAAALAACAPTDSNERLRFAVGQADVEVVFRGEVDDAAVFGAGRSLLDAVHPVRADGKRTGVMTEPRPGWLHFEYQIDGKRREVLVAKRPLMNKVSWDDVSRAGAVEVDADAIARGVFAAEATIQDVKGQSWRVRLPTCGQSTFSPLSEWNLLIGAVHVGDHDFKGPHYGWIREPYDDEDLKVAYHGSLSWCQEPRQAERVTRGYFFVSRFHAADPTLRTDRLHWRPVLERAAASSAQFTDDTDVIWSPSRRVGFAGAVSHEALFGARGIAELVQLEAGQFLGNGKPDWLRFHYQGRELLVAARPVKSSLSWDEIAQAGAALGDDSSLRIGWKHYDQSSVVQDIAGRRYRVRLMKCGTSTLDMDSEWNALIGGIHEGDGDFVAVPLGVYGWLRPGMKDDELGIGVPEGTASWCHDRIEVAGKLHGVNRGYLTVSRFHATETKFSGSGFGWRPVLEPLP